jgi:hypothetical protein
METKQIKFDDANSDWLLCPGCGFFGGLHHDRVTVFDRIREDGPSTVTEVKNGKVIRLCHNSNNNPSSRRDGIAIRFWCECCDAISELTIAQHKGTTEMEWRIAGRELRRLPLEGA